LLCRSVVYEELKETSCPLILTSRWVILGPFPILPGLANTSATESEAHAYATVWVPDFWEAGTTVTPTHGSCCQSSSVKKQVWTSTALSAPPITAVRPHSLARQQDRGMPQAQCDGHKHMLTPSLLFPAKHPPLHARGMAGAISPLGRITKRTGGDAGLNPPAPLPVGGSSLKAGLGLGDPRSKAMFS